MAKILVIGGGFGGAAAALTARQELGEEHEVTLLDRSRTLYLCGAMTLLIIGRRAPDTVSRSLETLESRGVRFRQADVQSVDTAGRVVRTDEGAYEYDYLVLSPGAQYAWDRLPGSESAYSFYGFDVSTKLQDRLRDFNGGRIAIAVSAVPYKCPPAPYEAAMLLDWHFRQAGIRDDVQIDVYTPEPQPLGVAGPEAVSGLKANMEERGIGLHPEMTVTEITSSGQEMAFSNGSSERVDVPVVIPPHEPASVVQEAGLVGKSGWVDVSPETLETSVAGVYAIGDVNAVPMANGRPLPKAGVFAASQGETVARNIAAAVKGEAPAKFPGAGYCFLATDGENAALVEGEFMAEGAPQVSLKPGSPDGMRRKERFEEDWREFRV